MSIAANVAALLSFGSAFSQPKASEAKPVQPGR
jgi:hypothetical protein